MTGLDATGGQHLLAPAQAQGKPKVQPDGVADRFSREAVASVARRMGVLHPSPMPLSGHSPVNLTVPAVERHLREFDRLGNDLQVIERDLARSALADESVARLMTIPGVDMVVALALAAAIGDIQRFEAPQKLVRYLGLNPSVRQSGPGPAYHGRITKQGRGHARGMLVEAAWAAARAPGPLRAFFLRVRARRGQHVAAVATARKLAVVIWHLLSKGESYV